MLAERLDAQWQMRRARGVIDPVMRFSDEGLVLGAGTLLAPAGASSRDIAIDTADPSLLALLTAAHRRTPTVSALRHLGKAAERWRVGDDAMAAIHLTLSRLDRLGRADADAHRLFLADGLLRAGLEPEVLVKALDLGERDDLARYSPDQPRVPAGSGRSSGEWTAGSGGGDPAPRTPLRPSQAKPELAAARPARPSAGASPAIVGAAIGVGKAETSLDLGAMTARGLSGLAAFVAGLADVSAVAAGLGLAAGAGVLLIPSAGPRGKWVQVGGQGDLSYFFSPDEPGITFRYTTADGVQRTWSAGPEGPDHGYRGPDGRIIARWVKTAGKVALVVSTAALVGPRADQPQVCPAPSPDNGGPLGRRYEDFVKAQFNPGNPTPSGLAYEFFDPREGKFRKIDDCKWQAGLVAGRPFEAGALAEYKGPGYAEHLLTNDIPWQRGMQDQLDEQAVRQVSAAGGRSLTWFVAEKPFADYLTAHFKAMDLRITVMWLPYPGRRR